MRVVSIFEKKKRGCPYCLHVETGRFDGCVRTACPYYKCPFTVLDKYKTYEEFMASEDSKILVDEFFISFDGGFDFHKSGHTNNVSFTDGDGRVDL